MSSDTYIIRSHRHGPQRFTAKSGYLELYGHMVCGIRSHEPVPVGPAYQDLSHAAETWWDSWTAKCRRRRRWLHTLP